MIQRLNILAIIVIGLIFSACSGSDGDSPTPIAIIRTSITEGSEVAASDITSIQVTYSSGIALNNKNAITLNGTQINNASVSNMILTIPVTLIDGTSYTLIIPANAVKSANNDVEVPSITLHFSTKASVSSDFDITTSLSNVNATQQAKNVYKFLLENFGKKTLSGVMAEVSNNNKMSDWVFTVTGKRPALTCYDYIFINYSPANWIDYNDIAPAKTQWDNNGLVAYMWHWTVPTNETDPVDKYGFYCPSKSSDGQGETQFDIREALKEGTWQHEFILKDIEKVAGYLRLLQDQNIAVIWRPLHEAAGSYKYGAWFWWGRYGTEYTKQLWKLLYDKLTNEYKLNNLIWVWTMQIEDSYDAQALDAYPGNDYVDIVGTDIYADNTNSQIAVFNKIKEITKGRKIITLAETGTLQDPDKCYAEGDTWSWFMEWYKYGITSSDTQDAFKNSAAYWTQVMSNKNIMTRESMPNLK